jgi:hypothetical protein
MKNLKGILGIVAGFFGISTFIIATQWAVLAQVPQPVLKIAPLGNNQFLITITNGVGTNYLLYWKPYLDESYTWQAVATNLPGENQFEMDAATSPAGFFRVLVGWDADGDGAPDWQDAQPGNADVGILSLTIDSPLNGSTLN